MKHRIHRRHKPRRVRDAHAEGHAEITAAVADLADLLANNTKPSVFLKRYRRSCSIVLRIHSLHLVTGLTQQEWEIVDRATEVAEALVKSLNHWTRVQRKASLKFDESSRNTPE